MQIRKQIRHLFQPRALVLMYHRIAEPGTDPWQLAVSPANFEQHLQVLQRMGTVTRATDLVASIHDKAVANKSLCLTFDDGYTDNYKQAKPLLEKYQLPATFFIPTYYIDQQRQFWWDELQDIMLLQPALPANCVLKINGAVFKFNLGGDSVLTEISIKQHQQWAWPSPAPTLRCQLYLDIWERIRPLTHDKLESVMQQIKSWAAFRTTADVSSFPMSLLQLRDLANHPFIDLGLHTATHPALSYHNIEIQQSEIAVNKRSLEKLSAKPLTIIAYPYGHYNATTLDVVHKLQLKGAFTTSEKIVSNLTNPFQIGRFQVRNWDGKEFENWLLRWQKLPQYL